ncbi:hypothetical protein Nepgr_030097 [Nepenthes gracilis]|uniref:Uncharacterized protein n=1 Tax=Nepenthes gracilis TaxID=150966 RepID=A0AAD3TFK8_NEPGR|nr:hypothetical protein Nepgr_030097 [Nepenthes gracilis]
MVELIGQLLWALIAADLMVAASVSDVDEAEFTALVEVDVDHWKPVQCSSCHLVGHSMPQCSTTKVSRPIEKILPSLFPTNVPTKGVEPLEMKSDQVMQGSPQNHPCDIHNSKLVDCSIPILSNSFTILHPNEEQIYPMSSQHSDMNTTLLATAHVDVPLSLVVVGPTPSTLEMIKHCPDDPSFSDAFSDGENSS